MEKGLSYTHEIMICVYCLCSDLFLLLFISEGHENSECEVGEREHATALLMACKHLPSQLLSAPGQRAGMLAQAAKTYEKIGDKKSLSNCHQLMMKYGTTNITAQVPVKC